MGHAVMGGRARRIGDGREWTAVGVGTVEEEMRYRRTGSALGLFGFQSFSTENGFKKVLVEILKNFNP
jgi:hypothetical protein